MAGWLRWSSWRLGAILEMWDGNRLWWCGARWPRASSCWCRLMQVPPPAHLTKEAPTSIDQDPAKLQPYLMGMWQDVWVDPNAWAIGPLPVSHFVAKSAARRKLLLDLLLADVLWVAAAAWCAAVQGGHSGHGAGAAGCGVLLSHGLRWG